MPHALSADSPRDCCFCHLRRAITQHGILSTTKKNAKYFVRNTKNRNFAGDFQKEVISQVLLTSKITAYRYTLRLT